MKKLSLFVMPLMAVSFLASCGGNNTPQAIEHFVTFESKGGTHIDTQRIKDGETATEPTKTPERADYEFKGWFTDDLTFENEYKFTELVTDDVTLYAKWNPVGAVTHTITFMKDGAYYDDIDDIEPGHIIENTELPETPEKSGYTFIGWCADEGGKNIFDFSKIEIRQDYELYAGWEPIVPATTYAITFMNGTKAGEITGINPGAIITKQTEGFPEDPSKTGYAFIGWCTDEAGKNVFDFPNMPIYHNHTLYAGFERNIIISFKNDGQPYGDGVEIEKGTVIPSGKIPTDPTKQDYTFIGWGSDTSGKHLVDLSTTKFYEDTTLYANWSGSEVITYEVNAEEFNEAISMENETYLQCTSYIDNFGSASMQISEQATYMKTNLKDGFVNVYQYVDENDEKHYQSTNTGEGWSEPALISEAQVLTPAGIGDDVEEELTLRDLSYGDFTYKETPVRGSYIYSNVGETGIHTEIELVFENKRLMSFTCFEYIISDELNGTDITITTYVDYQMKYEEIVPPDPRNP